MTEFIKCSNSFIIVYNFNLCNIFNGVGVHGLLDECSLEQL